MNTHGLNNNFLYAVSKVRVLLVNSDFSKTAITEGTGFFIVKDDKEYFITNRHVLDAERMEQISGQGFRISQIYIDHRCYDKDVLQPLTEELYVKKFNYLFADNEYDDIACISNIEWANAPTFPMVRIGFELLATTEMFHSSFSVCDLLAFIGFPNKQYDKIHNLPILRSGVISSDPRVNFPICNKDQGNVVAYEAFSTGGSSGSPIFALQKGIELGEGLSGPDDFYRSVKLIGINAGHLIDAASGSHSQLSYFFRSDQIISLIDKVENN